MPRSEASGWEARVTAGLDPRSPLEQLVEVCLAYSPLHEPTIFEQPADLPPGRPTQRSVRAAATALVERCEARLADMQGQDAPSVRDAQHEDERGRLLQQLVIGLLHRWAAPGAGSGGPDELPQAVSDLERARAIADHEGDAELGAWACWQLGNTLYRQSRHHEAVAVLLEGVRTCRRLLADPDVDRPLSFAAAAGSSPALEPPPTWRSVLTVLTAKRLHEAASSAGDHDAWTLGWITRSEVAPSVRDTRPVLFAQAIQGRAGRARTQGDRAAMRAAQTELEQLAADTPEATRYRIERVLSATKVGNAEALKDWSTCLDSQLERLDWLLATVAAQRRRMRPAGETAVGRADDGASEVVAGFEDVSDVLQFLQQRGDRTWRAAIGNAALGAATSAYRLGTTATDPDAWDHAWRQLDLAELAYRDYGSNGFVAIELTRTRLLHFAPGGPRRDLADTVAGFLRASREGKTSALRRNAVINAVEVCMPDDPDVAERLAETIADDRMIQGPRLRGAKVMYDAKGRDPDPAALELAALDAAADLEPAGRLLDPVLATECWMAAAACCAPLGRPAELRLERLLRAVRCLSTQLVTVSSPEERRALGRRYSGLMREAADAAVEVGDVRAAELVMEAMRRDQVGSVLVSLIRDPGVAEAVKSKAEAVQLTNAVAPTTPRDVPPSATRRWVARSAEELAEAQRAASRSAARVLGPLAALSDPSTLTSVDARRLLEAQAPSGTRQRSAVWQLLPASSGFLDSSRPEDQRLFWAVSTRDADGTVREYCGVMPFEVTPEQLRPPEVFWHSYYLAAVLLPEPLRAFLLESTDGPVRLTIVPTGLLSVPFDALWLCQESGVQLVDRAATTIVGSIASATALVDLEEGDHTTGASDARLAQALGGQADAAQWLTVFDTERLPATARELAAVRRLRPDSRRAGCTTAMLERLRKPTATLVMGVHGSDDGRTGWAQSKLLPNGSTISALDILRHEVPRHVVLASCHSAIVASAGVELGGFPMAMLLRGARTIIGTLWEVPDEVSATVMEQYWAAWGTGLASDVALQRAKRRLLDEREELRTQPGAWAALVLYGQP